MQLATVIPSIYWTPHSQCNKELFQSWELQCFDFHGTTLALSSVVVMVRATSSAAVIIGLLLQKPQPPPPPPMSIQRITSSRFKAPVALITRSPTPQSWRQAGIRLSDCCVLLTMTISHVPALVSATITVPFLSSPKLNENVDNFWVNIHLSGLKGVIGK